jgi:selenocysteine-specific elongation factor
MNNNSRMTSIIVGTAGHIDHGKTALVGALTGIDTDRLQEEKRRGISIDLGFAHLDLPAVRIGFVDVPGHERFVRNMLAGAAGIDALLLVVAANESIRPQTREHFDICRLLGVRRGLIALTKCDLVDADIASLVRLEIEEFVRGSFLEAAPIVALSATTGQGLDQLRQELARLGSAPTAKDASRHFRLPVDRVFTRHGFGTVVTGTLVSGAVHLEQEVEAYPLGRRLRVRGIQVHGRAVSGAIAGERTALNITGAEPAELHRGHVLSEPGLFAPTREIGCRLELLPGAAPLRHRAPLHFHSGTAEVRATARLVESLDPLPAGACALLRFTLEEPLLLLPGDRFIVRRFSPVATLGGGVVLDPAPPCLRRSALAAHLQALAAGDSASCVRHHLAAAPFGAAVAALVRRTALLPPEIERAATLLHLPEPWMILPERLSALGAALREAVTAFHRANPLRPGIPREQLRAAVLASAPAALLDELLALDSTLVAEADAVRLASHRVALQQDEQQALDRIESLFAAAGLRVPSERDVLSASGIDAARARRLLEILLRSRRLVRISADLVFHPAALEALKSQLVPRCGQRFSVADFKEWTGVSRKYAIPLLEYLDRQRLTRREGDQRVVL